MPPLDKCVRSVLRTSLNLKANDNFLILIEDPLAELGELVWSTARKITKGATLIKFCCSKTPICRIPPPVLNCLNGANPAIILLTKSIKDNVFEPSRKTGCRILLFQNTSRSHFENLLEANYKKIAILSRKLADLFSIGKCLHLQTPSGTDIEVPIAKIKGVPETGMAHNPGEIISLPAGEARLDIRNQNISGRIVIDRIAGIKKKLASPVIINIHEGYITQIKGKKEAEELRKSLRRYGKNGRKICELGVGTNNKAKWGNSPLEDEKLLGTVHFSLGQEQGNALQNRFARSPRGILLNATLSIDSKVILQNGIFQI